MAVKALVLNLFCVVGERKNATDVYNFTSLHFAAERGHKTMVQLLAKAGE